MIIKIILTCIVILTTACMLGMLYKVKKQTAINISLKERIKLFSCGIVAFVADTIGVGSFAVNTALAKMLNTFKDEELPAMNNGAQVLPGAISAFFFITAVDVDLTTLLTLVIGTCVGGVIGGGVVSHFNRQAIRVTMMSCFSLIATLLVLRKFELIPIGGDDVALHSWKLVVGFLGMAMCGILSSAGVGLFALVQGVLFLLGMSPIVAFPIMMTAGAMQQPLTTMMFLRSDKIPLRKTLILTLGGCIGVVLVLPIFKYLTASWLHGLLLTILLYNIYAISKAYFKSRNSEVTITNQEAA